MWQPSLSCYLLKDLLHHIAHWLSTVAKLLGKGGFRSFAADSLLMKQQLLIIDVSNVIHHERHLWSASIVTH